MGRHTAKILIGLLVVTNGFWTYRSLDNGITITYMEASQESSQRRYEQAVVLANHQLIGRTVEEAKEIIGKDVFGSEPFEKEKCLYVDQICLALDENRTILGLLEK